MQMSLPPLDLENSSPVIAHDVVQIPDAYSRYTNFKYRLWFTYYMYTIWDETAHSLQWLVTACVVDDLWFWEEEDEECIQEFAKALPLESFPETVMSMDSKYWDKACQDLGARRSQTMASPLAHVTPQIRLRFMAWLILAGPLRKDIGSKWNELHIDSIIFNWARSLNLDDGLQNPAKYVEFHTSCPSGSKLCCRYTPWTICDRSLV
jgi:hypothetical protein